MFPAIVSVTLFVELPSAGCQTCFASIVPVFTVLEAHLEEAENSICFRFFPVGAVMVMVPLYTLNLGLAFHILFAVLPLVLGEIVMEIPLTVAVFASVISPAVEVLEDSPERPNNCAP